MIITRETDYALRILRALSDGNQKSIEEISQAEATPKQFAYRIVKKLQKMDWVSISRGAEGGCRLIVDLTGVNLYQLMIGMGNKVDINACMQEGYTCSRRTVCHETCQIHRGLCQIQKSFCEELQKHSIHSLIFGKAESASDCPCQS